MSRKTKITVTFDVEVYEPGFLVGAHVDDGSDGAGLLMNVATFLDIVVCGEKRNDSESYPAYKLSDPTVFYSELPAV